MKMTHPFNFKYDSDFNVLSRIAFGIMAVSLTASTAMADWNSLKHKTKVGYHRNNAWPDPFNEADAMDVVRPFEIMKQNGWKLHNTIGHELFREGDGALLASGNRRVHWIATQAPAAHRQVFVLRGHSSAETEARIASVRQSLANIETQGRQTRIVVTDVEPGTASGKWADKIGREWYESLPKPQLPQTSVTGEQGAATPSGS